MVKYSRTKVYEQECAKGNKRATLTVARKLVAYMMAVDKKKTPFKSKEGYQLKLGQKFGF